jgi:excisionase family DNA binding protein
MTLLTSKQAGERIGLSTRSVLDLVKAGKLAVYRVGPSGGRTWFKVADLDAYLESCRKFGSRLAPLVRRK